MVVIEDADSRPAPNPIPGAPKPHNAPVQSRFTTSTAESPYSQSGPTVAAVNDLSERIDTMSSIVNLWPEAAVAGSGFAADEELCPVIPTYVVARFQILTSLRRLRDAARLSKEDDGWGSHVLMLRPALVLAAKAAWIVSIGPV